MSATSIQLGQVLYRHNQAMGVVDRVDDSDARWALLGFVLEGSKAVSAAIEASEDRPRLCSVDGCGRPHQAHGYCMTHYIRHRRTGTPGDEVRSYRRRILKAAA